MATNFNVLATAKQPGQIHIDLAVPAAASRLTLASGLPDGTENPNAFHLGLTNSGSKIGIEVGTSEEYFDEFAEALEQNVDSRILKITAELSQVMDFDVLEAVTNGIGSRVTASGYDSITLGTKALAYTSVALIFPLKEDSTKYGVFHIYKGLIKTSVDMAIARQERAAIPIEIMGVGIPGRAAADTMGNLWKEVAV